MSNDTFITPLLMAILNPMTTTSNTLISSSKDEHATPNTLDAEALGIQPEHISPGALWVINTLQKAGHQAYIVGGGIRDLLLEQQPKDFDIATDAHPETVKGLFQRSCRLIGRRFRLAHVRYQRERIEVATFRCEPGNTKYIDDGVDFESNTEPERENEHTSAEGLVINDNAFGTLEEDALRRDFTINALYYDPNQSQILDFFGGLKDLQAHQLKMIGEADKRCQEDPVRTLRAARLASKLNFTLNTELEAAITKQAALLDLVPPARKFDEFLKLFLNGCAKQTLDTLLQLDLLIYLFPCCHRIDEHTHMRALLEQTAENTDERIHSGKHVTPAFLLAAILWYSYRDKVTATESGHLPPLTAMSKAYHETLYEQSMTLSIPKRFSLRMREIWELQQRLPKRYGQRAYSTLEHPRFRAGYDFLLLRESIDEIPKGLGDWWTEFQFASEEEQQSMVQSLTKKSKKRKKRSTPPR